MFGNKEKELELLKLKESILSKEIQQVKTEPKQIVISDKEQFIQSLSQKISDYIEKAVSVKLKEAEAKKSDAIIKAKKEQFDDDLKNAEENKKELIGYIITEIDKQIEEAKNHYDGAVALMFLGILKRKIEEI